MNPLEQNSQRWSKSYMGLSKISISVGIPRRIQVTESSSMVSLGLRGANSTEAMGGTRVAGLVDVFALKYPMFGRCFPPDFL